MNWEQIDDYHLRAKVIGGWIVKAYEDVMHQDPNEEDQWDSGYDYRVAICFVPDQNHEWKLEEDKAHELD